MGKGVLLVQPSVLYSTWGGDIRPAHLVPIASFIQQHGIDSRIISMRSSHSCQRSGSSNRAFVTLGDFLADCEYLLDRYEYDVLAVSCWTSLEYVSSFLLGIVSKVMNPDAVTVVGGYHPSTIPSDFLKSVKKMRFKIPDSERRVIDIPNRLTELMVEGRKHQNVFDYVVRGEGEIALYKIGKEITNGHVKEREPRVVNGEPLQDINKIDYDYSLLLDEDGSNAGETIVGDVSRSDVFPIHVSRSCPFNCRFCVEKSKEPLHWRALTPKRSVGLIKSIINDFGPHFIYFVDPCFGVDREWKKKFFELLAQEVGKNVHYWCETNVNLTSREDLSEFSKLHFAVDFGVESASGEMLRLMNKAKNPAGFMNQHKKLVDTCVKLSVPSQSYFIWGFPGETKQTLEETLKYQNDLLKIAEKYHYIEVAGQFFFLTPGSHVYQNMIHYSDEFGTVFRIPGWWRYLTRNLQTLATSIDPSRDLSLEEESELVSYEFGESLKRIHNKKMCNYRWVSARMTLDASETLPLGTASTRNLSPTNQGISLSQLI